MPMRLYDPPRMSVATRARVDPAIDAEIRKRHDESIKRLQEWIGKPTVAARGIGVDAAHRRKEVV
jgi:hypothetical protein